MTTKREKIAFLNAHGYRNEIPARLRSWYLGPHWYALAEAKGLAGASVIPWYTLEEAYRRAKEVA